ncbi:MAG TPA: trigger factor [Patescibacteria group bacterium]|nr:trigger factor [Patescibacteria group bacterium]
MQIKIANLSDTEIKLTITADESALEPIKNKVLRHLSTKTRLSGFREGKAPLNLVEKNVDQNVLQREVLEEAMNTFYARAVAQEKLRPVTEPKANLKKFVPFSDLEVELTVPVVGSVKLANYKNIKKTKPVVKITDKDLNEVIVSLQKRMAEKTPVDRPSKAGDEAIIDFSGVDTKGKAINNADGKDYPLQLGSNVFIPGFEENVIGLKSGGEKSFTLTFPKDYGVKAMANQKVTFKVHVTQVNELKEPELGDEFAAKVGPFKNMDELRADIKKQLAVERQQEVDRNFTNELIQEISAKSEMAIPSVLVDEQVERGEQEERRNINYRGQTWQEHLEEEGVTEEEHRSRNRKPAEQQVKASLVLSEIAEQESLSVSPEEVEIRMQVLKGQYKDPAMLAELEQPSARQDIAMRLLTEKTINKLLSYISK